MTESFWLPGQQKNQITCSFQGSSTSSDGSVPTETDMGRGGFAKPGHSWGDREGTQEDKETLNGIVKTQLQDPRNKGGYIWRFVYLYDSCVS